MDGWTYSRLLDGCTLYSQSYLKLMASKTYLISRVQQLEIGRLCLFFSHKLYAAAETGSMKEERPDQTFP